MSCTEGHAWRFVTIRGTGNRGVLPEAARVGHVEKPYCVLGESNAQGERLAGVSNKACGVGLIGGAGGVGGGLRRNCCLCRIPARVPAVGGTPD